MTSKQTTMPEVAAVVWPLKTQGEALNSDPKDSIKLTKYKNGFRINDEEFRPYSDPKNVEFMKEMDQKYVPKELVERGYKDLKVGVSDKSGENFEEPVEEKKFAAFEGAGVSMGGVGAVGLDINTNVETGFDPNKPTTKISIRLHSGEVVSKDFNLEQKLSDIYDFVTLSAPVDGNFQLIDGFPPAPLTDVEETIQKLGLQNSMITQKLL